MVTKILLLCFRTSYNWIQFESPHNIYYVTVCVAYTKQLLPSAKAFFIFCLLKISHILLSQRSEYKFIDIYVASRIRNIIFRFRNWMYWCTKQGNEWQSTILWFINVINIIILWKVRCMWDTNNKNKTVTQVEVEKAHVTYEQSKIYVFLVLITLRSCYIRIYVYFSWNKHLRQQNNHRSYNTN